MDGETNMCGIEKRIGLGDCGLDLFGLKQRFQAGIVNTIMMFRAL
jgi:hypothetical protein